MMTRHDESASAGPRREESPRIDLHPDVLTRRVGEELVLVHLGRNKIFSLNSTGARLWELLVEGLTISEVTDRITSDYDVEPKQVQAEVDGLLARLSEEGLVRRTE